MSETINNPLLAALCRQLRESAADPVESALQRLVEDTASEAERDTLTGWARGSAARSRVLQMHEPIRGTQLSDLISGVLADLKASQDTSEGTPRRGGGGPSDDPEPGSCERRGRRAHESGVRRLWFLGAPAAGLAAAVSLWTMGGPTPPLPRYRLEVLSARSTRRGPASGASRVAADAADAAAGRWMADPVDPSAGLSLVIRPEVDLQQASDVTVRVFLEGTEPFQPVQVDVQVAPGGAMRLEVPSLMCPGRARGCSLVLLVGERGAVQSAIHSWRGPDPSAHAAHSGASKRWQLLRLPLRMGRSIPPSP